MNEMLRNMTSLYIVDDGGVLCLYRVGSRVADGLHVGSAGGHFEEGELNDPKACVLREAGEELALAPEELEDLRLRYITHRLKDGQIRQNYYFFARLKESRSLRSNEGTLRYVPWEELETLQMPLSAKHMILHYRDTGRFDSHLYCGITESQATDFRVLAEFEGR